MNYMRLDRRGRRRLAAAAAHGPLYFDLESLRDRDLAVIGPAAPVADELAHHPPLPDSLILRINRGLLMAAERPDLYCPGTDILVHNLNEEGPRGTGPLSLALMREQGVAHLLYPHSAPHKIKQRILDRHAKMLVNGAAPDLRLMPQRIYSSISAELSGYAPTAGTAAIALALVAPLRSLAIYGFTFFQTSYSAGYNDAVITASDAQAWARASDLHDPGKEARVIANQLDRHRNSGGCPVYLGSGVAKALAAVFR